MKPSDIKQEFVSGDIVEFDVENSNLKPYGRGTITIIDGRGGFRMQPNAPIPAGLRIINIRKAGTK